MPRVYVSIGSNLEPAVNVRRCVDTLAAEFAPVTCSPVYVSAAVGFAGDDFYNLVVGFDTDLDVAELKTRLRQIEDMQGRQRGPDKFAPRTLDLDLITYGSIAHCGPGFTLPHPDILAYPFVLKPLADIAPDEYHATARETYATLWQRMAASATPLKVLADFFPN